MKKLLAFGFAVALAAAAFGDFAASRGWVTNYVARQMAGPVCEYTFSNGLFTAEVLRANGTTNFTISAELANVPAVVVANVTDDAAALGVTNGMLFAWNGTGEFRNHELVIYAFAQNFTFNGEDSSPGGDTSPFSPQEDDYFQQYFSFKATLVTASERDELLTREVSFWSFANPFACYAGNAWQNHGNYGSAWYSPSTETPRSDTTFNVAYWNDHGEQDLASFNVSIGEDGSPGGGYSKMMEWMAFYGSDVESVAMTVSELMVSMARLNKNIQKEFETLAGKLDQEFAALYKALEGVEDEDSSGQVVSKRKTGYDAGTKYIHFNNASHGDGNSIVSKSTDKGFEFSLMNFEGESYYQVPFVNTDQKLGWGFVDELMSDPFSYVCDKNGYRKATLKNWNAPTGDGTKCSNELADMLTGGAERDNHYILTRYNDGNIHYTPLGTLSNLTASASSAIKFVGTSGSAVIGSGSETNTVTFASDGETDFRAEVAGDGKSVKITFGLRYK